MSIGVPIKILHEAEGHVVTIESITSEIYRGKLIEAEDNMNCQLSNVSVTYRDGRQAQLEYIYVRGSKIRFMIFPDMLKVKTKSKPVENHFFFSLKNAPMFKNMRGVKSGASRGKSAILRAQIARGRGVRGRPPLNSFAGQAGGRGTDRGAMGGGRGRGDR